MLYFIDLNRKYILLLYCTLWTFRKHKKMNVLFFPLMVQPMFLFLFYCFMFDSIPPLILMFSSGNQYQWAWPSLKLGASGPSSNLHDGVTAQEFRYQSRASSPVEGTHGKHRQQEMSATKPYPPAKSGRECLSDSALQTQAQEESLAA